GSWYEGDWVNGNRTGKGVYRWLGVFTYEGDFLNNDLHGHARVVYDDGSWYEGEYKNDKQMGKCKIYFGEGDWAGSTFEGEVIDGFWNEADGIMTMPDGATYEGHFESGIKSGDGYLRYPNGDYMSGNWNIDTFSSYFTGEALLHVENGNIFKGNIDDDNFIYGTYTYANGDVYEGEFDGGVPCSITDEDSTMTYANGATYTGHFWNGDWSGEGTYVDENGVSYYCEEWDGFFKASEDYDVTMTTPDGDEVVGKIADGEFVADDESWGDEEIEEEPEVKEDAYEGERNSYGQPHGVGKMRYANGETYEGEWKNGAWYGAGIYTLSDGTTFFGSFIGTRASESVVKNGCVRGRLTNGIFFAK
ncbi:MAG: hypothetical protein IKA43_02200, partial [Clostridia bacterium]|nr:hypothetical protein [Clostridia bacterium]